MSAGRSDLDGEAADALPTTRSELCKRYEQLFSGAINDVLRDLGYLRQTLPHTIRPLRDDMKLAGFAFTSPARRISIGKTTWSCGLR